MYLDVADVPHRKIFLTVIGLGKMERAFRIKVTQVMEANVPPDCLQFHENISGYIKSFNYDNSGKVVQKVNASYLVSFKIYTSVSCIVTFP